MKDDGEAIGRVHANPLFDTGKYVIEFTDGARDTYLANEIVGADLGWLHVWREDLLTEDRWKIDEDVHYTGTLQLQNVDK